jgi:hypothetical protein
MKKVIVPCFLSICCAICCLADSFLNTYFPGLSLGMSTNQVLAVRSNASDYPYSLGEGVSSLGELIQTNSSTTAFVYYFTTNGLRALARSGACLVNGSVVRDTNFDAQVSTSLSNNFTYIAAQAVQYMVDGKTTNVFVEMWSENSTTSRVAHLSVTDEASVIYFDPNSLSVSNFFLLP